MSRTRTNFTLISALLLAGCGAAETGDPAHDRERPAILIQDGTETDTLTLVLIARQRDLFDAITKRDSARVASYLETRFGWQLNAVQSNVAGSRRTRLVGRPRPYADFIQGFVPEQLMSVPSHYEIRAGSEPGEALVEALWLDRTDRLVTRWVHVAGAWKARRTDAYVRRRD